MILLPATLGCDFCPKTIDVKLEISLDNDGTLDLWLHHDPPFGTWDLRKKTNYDYETGDSYYSGFEVRCGYECKRK